MSALYKSFTTSQTRAALQTGESALNDMFNLAKSLVFVRATIEETCDLPKDNIQLLRHVIGALDAYYGSIGAQQIGGNKKDQLAAVADTRTKINDLLSENDPAVITTEDYIS